MSDAIPHLWCVYGVATFLSFKARLEPRDGFFEESLRERISNKMRNVVSLPSAELTEVSFRAIVHEGELQ